MAELVFKNPYVTLSGVDLSSYIRAVTINYGAEIHDKTGGATNSKEKIAGLKDWSVTLELNQDFDAATVDKTLYDLVGAAAATLVINPNGSTTGATNPQYSGSVLASSYTPLGQSVGQYVTTSITLEGTGDLGRATT